MKVSVCILAGGKSRRFGEDKLLKTINGIPVLLYTWRVCSLYDDVAVVVKNPLKFMHFVPGRFVVEGYREFAAICGLIAGLRASRYDRVLFIPADVPFLKSQILDIMASLLPPFFVAFEGVNHYLLCGLLKSHLVEVEKMFNAGEMSIARLHEHLGSRSLNLSAFRMFDFKGCSFKNINTGEDFYEALYRCVG